MQVIAISGKIASGKNELAELIYDKIPESILADFPCYIRNLSYACKELLRNSFQFASISSEEISFSPVNCLTWFHSSGITLNDDQVRAILVLLSPMLNDPKYQCIWHSPNGSLKSVLHTRAAYILVGEGLKDILGPDFWVRATINQFENHLPAYLIVADIRRPQEIDCLKRYGKVLTIRVNANAKIRIQRAKDRDKYFSKGEDITPYLNHLTETALDDYPFDIVVMNEAQNRTKLGRVSRAIVDKYIMPDFQPLEVNIASALAAYRRSFS